MDEQTVQRLNRLNERFYRVVAQDFDESRSNPWVGFAEVVKNAPSTRPLRVLDLGCGNARFASYLSENLEGEFEYTGIDSCPELIYAAETRLCGILTDNFRDFTLIQKDLLKLDELDGLANYDLICLFGVIHHIPGAETRRQLLRFCEQHLADESSLIALAAWQAGDSDRLQKRRLPLPFDPEDGQQPFEEGDFEAGDALLDWKRGAYAVRYVHHTSEEEVGEWESSLGLKRRLSYFADGKSQSLNRYYLLSRA